MQLENFENKNILFFGKIDKKKLRWPNSIKKSILDYLKGLYNNKIKFLKMDECR